MSGSILIEHVRAAKNPALHVELRLDKERGMFFANLGGKRIESDKKADAIVKIRAGLQAISTIEWTQIILIRVYSRKDDDGFGGGEENGLKTQSASCKFHWLRRERAKNPFKPKQTVEREHPIDFEERVRSARQREMMFARNDKKASADSRERELRASRDALEHLHGPWDHWSPGSLKEYELPYSDEAWAGIERIAAALHETQVRLDAFASSVTVEKLTQIANAAAPLLLLGATKK